MDTNFRMIKALNEIYTPEIRGIVTDREVKLIKNTLCIDEMNLLQLQNLRDMTVMLYSQWADGIGRENYPAWDISRDKMSAITHVIDMAKIEAGGEV